MSEQGQATSPSQALMQLILKSSKATGQVLAAIQAAQEGEAATSQDLLTQAQALNIEAHNLQTGLIQAELQGQAAPVSLLAVHAQDHFMNSHLLVQVADILISQAHTIKTLEEKLEKLEEKVGEIAGVIQSY